MLRRLLCGFVLLIGAGFAHASVSPWLNFELYGGHIALPVTVSGHSTFAILDSGSQVSAINKAFMEKHELEYTGTGSTYIEGVFGKKRHNKFSNVPVGIFGTTMKIDNVVEVSLGHSSKGLLLGAALFQGNVMQIDYPNKKMRLISRDSVNLHEIKNVPMVEQRGSGRPLVEVSLNGRKTWLVLDTGNAGGIMIERSLAEGLDLANTSNQVHKSSGMNKSGNMETTRIDKVVFGPYTLENTLVSFNAEGSNINLNNQFKTTGTRIRGKKVEGLIGYEVLKHFVITMDYGRGYLHAALPE